ncbi:Arabinose-proton symporter (Arabinose transporter) [Irineochytrium annulatum]|nr:Arabinose-proton symporter (Arabinose transporter) [Irineochytrium annulatum]
MSVQSTATEAYQRGFALFHSFREYINPVLKNSKFRETGVLTPDEFVAAGDFLVYKCPTWTWSGGQEGKRRDYLPANKQYLITRNVPCLKRVKAMEYNAQEEDAEDLADLAGDGDADGGWVATHSNRKKDEADGNVREIEDMDGEEESGDAMEADKVAEGLAKVNIGGAVSNPLREVAAPQQDVSDIPDMDEEGELVEAEIEEDDPANATNAGGNDDKILRTRTYDMSITYDKMHKLTWILLSDQTPRVWLFGYDENRRPLTSQQVFEDISQDHAKKTVTIETHPHENLSLASIHPCRHGNVMKRLLDQMAESGNDTELRVDQYLLLFLKFMSSVLPTMEYDYTVSMDSM